MQTLLTMSRTLLWITFTLWCDFISAENRDECDLDKLLFTVRETLQQLVDPINSRFDDLNGKLDAISKEMQIQKSTIESMKESLDEPVRVENGVLTQQIESFHLKQLKDQNATKHSLESHANQLAEIQNIATREFSTVLKKLALIDDVGRSSSEMSSGIENLRGAYTQQEAKLGNVQDTLKHATDSINHATVNNTKRTETIQKDIFKALDEQSKPLSDAALSHVNKVASIAKIIATEMERFDDLEPKLLHLYHLSEKLEKELPNNPLINNMTVSLGTLKTSGPSAVSSVSENVKNLNGALQDLKALSKDNNCPADFTSELRDHHNKVIKYFNDTISGRKDEEDETWNELMKKLASIERSSATGSNVSEKLIKLREEINVIRDLLKEQLEESDTNDDTVFG